MIGMVTEREIEEHSHVQFLILFVRRQKRSAERVRSRKVQERIFLRGKFARILLADDGTLFAAGDKTHERQRSRKQQSNGFFYFHLRPP